MRKTIGLRLFVIMALIPFLASETGAERKEDHARAKPGPKGRIAISGAWALYPMVVKWKEEFQKLNPNVTVAVSAGGAGKGMADALSGTVELGMVSRDINQAEVEKGAWWVSVVKDAVAPTFSAANPSRDKLLKRGLTKAEFAAIWITDAAANWSAFAGLSDSSPIHAYTRSDACGAAETWAKYLGKNQEDLQGVGVYGDPGLAEAVRNDAFGVGFNNINFLYDSRTRKPVEGILALPIDVNENGRLDADESVYATLGDITKAIADGKYPSPPARELHLVSKGPPQDRVAIEFLRWILSDGQKYVQEAGYINLPEEQLKENVMKLSAGRKQEP